MMNFIYNSTGLSVKDRLTISNLLGLFQSRLNASWTQASQVQNKPAHLVLIDVDKEEGRQSWENAPKGRIAVTSDDRSRHQPFILRPIRAYGPNGVIVLFNSIAQSLSSAPPERANDRQPEPTRIRMMGRLESSPAPVRPIRPETPRAAAPPPAPKISEPVPEPPMRARVAVRWGPPEPVIYPPLAHMPGARIHWINRGDAPPDPPAVAPVRPAPPEPEVIQPRFFSAPGTDAPPPLINMPVAHRPTEIHAAPTPLIGRVHFEATPPAPNVPADVPVLRPAPPQWRTPEPEVAKVLIDFRSLADLTVSEPEPVAPEPVAAAAPSEEELLHTEFANIEAGLANLSNALLDENGFEELPEGDAGIDWWGTPFLEADSKQERPAESTLLIHALKAVKASGQPSILEIAGLPAVCVIPARNIYFTTAPAARLESVISARSEVSWRACVTEAEARQLSGTEQSRQSSLEQLFWTASLLTPPEDPSAIADQSVRLRRWPPITESRGRSKFIRYATMMSGAQATPRELSEITGDALEEIVCFVNACSMMNLLETSAQPKTLMVAPPIRSGGAGILRGMIEQLTPPKI